MMLSKTAIAGVSPFSGHAVGPDGANDPGSKIADLLSRTVGILEHRKLLSTKDVFSLAGASKALRYDVDLWDRIARLKRGQRATTSLMAAARAGNTERVSWLLKRKGVNVDDRQLPSSQKHFWESKESPSSALHKAVAKGHLATAEALIVEGGASLHSVDDVGMMPLHYAAKYGRAELVPLLVKHLPTSVDVEDLVEGTPLIRAAESPHGEAAALALLAHGANAREVDEQGFSVLHHTCATGHPLLFARLIAAGVDVNALTTTTRETPLLIALQHKKTALALDLMAIKDIKLDVARSWDGYEAVHVACQNGLATVVTQLLALKVSPSKRVGRGTDETPLMIAAKYNQRAVVDVLLATCKRPASSGSNSLVGWMNQGAGIDLKDSDGDTALALAVLHGHDVAMEQLLAAKAGVNIKNDSGYYPVHHALTEYQSHCLEILAKTPGIVWHRMPGPNNDTCLHFAVRSSSDYMLAAMLPSALVDLEAKNAEGRTPLLAAAANNKAEAVKKLLAAGANISARGSDGLTAAELATKAGHEAVTAVLMDAQTAPLLRAAIEGGQEETACLLIDSKMCLDLANPLAMACARNQSRVVEKLLVAGASPNTLFTDGTSVFSKACQQGFTTVVQKLLEHKANVNLRDPSGSTPMHDTVGAGKHAVIPLLLRYKADKEAVDNLGRSPAQVALSIFSGDERKKCFKHLLRAGVSIGKFDKDWKTILSQAVQGNEFAIVPMLLKAASDEDLIPLRAFLRNKSSACWNTAWGHVILELVDRELLLGPQQEDLGGQADDVVESALYNFLSGLTGPSQDVIDDVAADNEEEEEDDAELALSIWEGYGVGIKPYLSVIRWAIDAPHPREPEVCVPAVDEEDVRGKPGTFTDDGWRRLRTQPLRDDAWERRSRLVCCFASAAKNKEPEQKKAKAGAGEA
jgi:uncharacterized protein